MFDSGIEVSDAADILNCEPQILPSATDVPSKCSVETFCPSVELLIFSSDSPVTDLDIITSFAFLIDCSTCFTPSTHLFSDSASLSAFSSNFPIISLCNVESRELPYRFIIFCIDQNAIS